MDNRDIETELKKAADEAKNIGTKSADDRMCAIEHRLEPRPERSGGAERDRVPVASHKAGAISRGRVAVSVFAAVAPDLLRRIPAESPYYQKAQELIQALSNFEPLPGELVPGDSLLREFIG